MTYPRFLATPDTRWGQRQIIRFGGLPRPDTGVVQSFVDLNDADAWFAQSIQVDGRHISNKSSQLNWRGKAVWTAQDFIGRKILIPAMYDDGNSGNISYPQAKGVLTMAGEQYLTFDNVTGIRVRLNSFSQAEPKTPNPPYLWDAPLEFLSRNPFAEDLGGAMTLTGTLNGSGQLFLPVTYTGAAYGEPLVTITLPSGVTANFVEVANTTFGGDIIGSLGTVSTGGPLVVDSTLFAISLGSTAFPPGGTFPFLYPGTQTLYIAMAPGASFAGAAVSVSYANKFEI